MEKMKKVFYNKQYLDSSDFSEVLNSMKQKLITTGPYIDKLEKSIQKKLDVKYALACSSGTSAIFLALKSIDLKKNDVIIMPAINFIASANAATILGAKIYLADIDYESGQMTPSTLSKCIQNNKLKKIKAVVTMYLGGRPNNAIEFYKIKKRYKFKLIEDSCHALGARYHYNKKNFMVGCSKHCDISTFSLHPVKSITAGEGGIITTNNLSIFKRLKILRSHGMDRSNNFKNKNKYWNYDILLPSLNFRLSDINAALAYSQLKKLDKFIKNRNQAADLYYEKLRELNNYITTTTKEKKTISACHLMVILIDFKKLKIDKDMFIKLLINKKIYCQYHYIPIYKFSIYKHLKNKESFANSEKFYHNALSLPLYYNMGQKIILTIISENKKIVKKYGK